jgi:cGMP-dependent 3',5'-cyclic phosphodiesterase
MERHHISQTMSILNTEDCDIFQNLTADEYRSILDLIYDIILATDLSLHLSIINELEKMSMEGYDSSNPHHHHLLRSLLMTSCDLSACLKDWDDSVAVSKLIYSEFFSQGDKEKEIGMTPSVMMDRDKAIHSEQQLNFLDKIAIPVYKLLSQLLPETTSAYENLLTNYENWKHWPSQD